MRERCLQILHNQCGHTTLSSECYIHWPGRSGRVPCRPPLHRSTPSSQHRNPSLTLIPILLHLEHMVTHRQIRYTLHLPPALLLRRKLFEEVRPPTVPLRCTSTLHKLPTTRRPHAHNNMTFFRLCAFRAREPRSALERISAQRSVSMDMAPWCVWCILDAVYAAREVKVLNNTPSSASATITTPDAVDVWARARVCLSRNGSNCLFGQVSLTC